jgi:GTP-binding protein Era
MNIWNRVQAVLSNWRSNGKTHKPLSAHEADQQLLAANQNLKILLEDTSIPASVRAELADEFEQVELISRKLREEEIHIAAYGRVGVGKSSLLNALLGKEAFRTSPLHGETREELRAQWQVSQQGHVVLIDTPGIDELDGQEREELARNTSKRADVILMVCEGDLTDIEFLALKELLSAGRIVILVLNKSDRYSESELELLLASLRKRTSGYLPASTVVSSASEPRPEIILRLAADGKEIEEQRIRSPEVGDLKKVLWELLDREGKSLAALNASLFASELDEKVASRIVAARKSVAERIIHSYCVTKAVLVAVNPVPVADLLAAAGTDVAMVIHLGEIYGFKLSRREASKLLLTISAQLVALMGVYWGLNLVSSALKTASAGLSTALTATGQSVLAWYATYLTGQMAQSWFAKGKSWGENGPREVARVILSSLDRDSLIRSAREEMSGTLKLLKSHSGSARSR